MKRLLFILIIVFGAFVFFSFLAKTEYGTTSDFDVFYDEDLPESLIIVDDVTKRLGEAGYEVHRHSFAPGDISRLVMSHPDALFITWKPVTCEFYKLDTSSYLLVKVAVGTGPEVKYRLTGDEFDDILHNYTHHSGSRKGIRIISYQDITLDKRPLPVDGIMPSLYSIRTGTYSKVYRAYLHTRDGGIFDSRDGDDLIYDFGGWMERAFSIIAGGDIMLARGTGAYMKKHGYTYPFKKIAGEIEKHDISVANLESPLSTGGEKFFPLKGIYFRADPRAIDGLILSGFDVLTLANNHALDWGVGAISDTMDLLKRKGIQYTGVGVSRSEALVPAVIHEGETSIAFLSYNDIYPYRVGEAGNRMMTLTIDEGSIGREISRVRDKYDILVVLIHCGTEYMDHPEQKKVQKLRRFIDLGADVVLGTHPHVIQDIELYGGGLIAYSLGNLVFDQNWSKATSLGLLLEISFIGDNPVYYDPKFVYIENAQAGIISSEKAESILSSLKSERREYAYAER
jgi:poly-gamma-glutamate capsule biosynthesis protein CapA/YwtB (metallophosphatase superfamily)